MTRIGVVSEYSSLDVNRWSGVPYYMSRSLEDADHELVHFGPLHESWSLYYKGKTALFRGVVRKQYLRDREPRVLRSYAAQVLARLAQQPVDILFSPSTIPIAMLDTELPIAYWTDATFAGLTNFYERFSNLSRTTSAAGNAMEQAALDRATLAIYSSDWAAAGAVERYDVDPAKVKVVPFGANLDSSPTAAQVELMLASKPEGRCSLLFNGIDWERKGGDVAVEVARSLNEAGLETRLTIVGPARLPAGVRDLPFVHHLGFIDKSNPNARLALENSLSQAHFLILPARAECFGVVLCEANAYGVPFLTTRVGGIPTVARDDVNGRSFPEASGPDIYTDYVLGLFGNYARYRELARSSFGEYDSRLNWRTSGAKVRCLLDQIRLA